MSEVLTPSAGPPRDPLAEQLRLAITIAYHGGGDQDVGDELREAVCAFVKAQREVGTRAEAVVIAVKRIIDLSDLRGARRPERRALTERVVTWCISEYYRSD